MKWKIGLSPVKIHTLRFFISISSQPLLGINSLKPSRTDDSNTELITIFYSVMIPSATSDIQKTLLSLAKLFTYKGNFTSLLPFQEKTRHLTGRKRSVETRYWWSGESGMSKLSSATSVPSRQVNQFPKNILHFKEFLCHSSSRGMKWLIIALKPFTFLTDSSESGRWQSARKIIIDCSTLEFAYNSNS